MSVALTPFHIRGMTDAAGIPGVEIATVAVERMSDGAIKFVRPNGQTVLVRDMQAKKLFEDILGIDFLGV